MKRPLAFVIEDQISLSTLYEDALRLVGFDVIAIRDGLEALNKLEINEPPTFIILDINLPGLSGRDLLKHIRKHDRYDKTPVMILTANSVMATAIRPEITENDHLFIKPISMKALQEFAKLLRPGKDGVADYLAETQKIPPLPEFDSEEEAEETAKFFSIDEDNTDDKHVPIDTKSDSEAENTTASSEATTNTQTEKKAEASPKAEIGDKTESEDKSTKEKAPADNAEAKSDSKSENQ